MVFSGLWGKKGFIAHTASMHSSPVRYARPAGMSEEVCSNLPYSFWTCSRQCVGHVFHSCIASMYFFVFWGLRDTLRSRMFQTNPIYGVV